MGLDYNPLVYGQEHPVEISSTFREVSSLLVTNSTSHNLRLDGQWNHHPLRIISWPETFPNL